MKLKTGQNAPEFKLPDQNNQSCSLADYRGKWVLIYFYPKDDTTGCTEEACTLRDSFPKFDKLNTQVLGISTDSVKSHKKFEKKYSLNFTLLADEGKKVVNSYGVWQPKKFLGRELLGTLRISFLINPEGKIVKIYEKVKPPVHAQEVLDDLRTRA